MYLNGPAFLGRVPLVGQANPPAFQPPAPSSVPAAPPTGNVTAEQFRNMSSMQRSKVLDGLSSQGACTLYQQLYALTNDPKDKAFMTSWCKVASGK